MNKTKEQLIDFIEQSENDFDGYDFNFSFNDDEVVIYPTTLDLGADGATIHTINLNPIYKNLLKEGVRDTLIEYALEHRVIGWKYINYEPRDNRDLLLRILTSKKLSNTIKKWLLDRVF